MFILEVDAAAAEVFVHGCCSSLNKTTHHLISATPPPLVKFENTEQILDSQFLHF